MVSTTIFDSRYTQIAVNICTVITGFCTFLPLGYVWKYFAGQCVLYANLDVALGVTADQNRTVVIDRQTSVWGTSTDCNYTTFAAVVAVIHAFIWCWYFLLMKSLLKEENREYYLLLPSMLLHSIMFMIMFVSSSMVSAGSDTFCRNLRRKSGLTCAEAFKMSWDIFSVKNGNTDITGVKHNISRFLLTAKVSSWLMTLTILAQCLLTSYKLYKWFLQENKDYSTHRPKSRASAKTGSDNGGFVEDLHDSSDIDQMNIEQDFIHTDTGSLVRVT